MSSSEGLPCPACGRPVLRTDSQCMSCGAQLDEGRPAGSPVDDPPGPAPPPATGLSAAVQPPRPEAPPEPEPERPLPRLPWSEAVALGLMSAGLVAMAVECYVLKDRQDILSGLIFLLTVAVAALGGAYWQWRHGFTAYQRLTAGCYVVSCLGLATLILVMFWLATLRFRAEAR
jgi:hypothetical protein